MVDKTREIALKILYEIEKEKAYSNIILNKYIKENKEKLNSKDIGLISELTYGVTMWNLTLEEIIKKYSKIKLKKISPWIKNILKMGIYQIVFLDKIPKSAAVNESVTLAKRYGHTASSNFVNAILRKVEKQDYLEFAKISNQEERISKMTSMPIWIVKQLLKETKDIKNVEKICINLNQKPKITVRINRLKINEKNLEKLFKEQKIEYIKISEYIKDKDYENKDIIQEIGKDFYILSNLKDIENTEVFKMGYITIQDLSAGMSAFLLNPKKKEKILDACSAPRRKNNIYSGVNAKYREN